MLPRYVIHVGPLKTGSTYIQQCLFGVRRELTKVGIHYPDDFIGAGNNHMTIYGSIVRKAAEKLRPIFTRINSEGHNTVVLSCEHLIFLTPDEWSTLRDVIGVPDITIVYAVRRWSDRIGSIWNQGLFMGGHQTLPEFYLRLLDGRIPEYYPSKVGDHGSGYDIDYSLAWRDIISVFGRGALTLFPYSTLMDAKEDVFVRFCKDVLGLQEVTVPKFLGRVRWFSLPAEDAELLRVLNARYFKEYGQTTVHIRNIIKLKRVEFDREKFAAAMSGDIAKLAIHDRAVHFDSAYSNMMAFADCIAPQREMQTELFSRVTREAEYYHQNWLLEPGMAVAVKRLFNAVMKAMEVDPRAWAANRGPELKPTSTDPNKKKKARKGITEVTPTTSELV